MKMLKSFLIWSALGAISGVVIGTVSGEVLFKHYERRIINTVTWGVSNNVQRRR